MTSVSTSAVQGFISGVASLYATGRAREHAYRPLLERLFASFNDVLPINDPARSAHGNPDFVFLRNSNRDITIGYGEAKDLGVDLDKELESEQITRYTNYENLIFTNGLEFIFFRSGQIATRVGIARLEGGRVQAFQENFELLLAALETFFTAKPERIKSANVLANVMARAARLIRAEVTRLTRDQSPELTAVFSYIKSELVHDLDETKFADMYAQTLVYGLFAARHSDQTLQDFTRYEARDLIPESNPFLRVFFDHIAGQAFERDLAYIVNELCESLALADVKQLVGGDKVTQDIAVRDPIIHFYEDFLAQYDPELRKKLGAYYTPLPIANYLISQVDEILKSYFGFPDGLLDSSESEASVELSMQGAKYRKRFMRVQVLDPAVGTGTFLNQLILYVASKFEGNEGALAPYVKEHLLPRLHGFELMMGSYTIAHMKLTHTLNDLGIYPNSRLHLYLTNTLDNSDLREPDIFQSFGLSAAISLEAALAAEVKEKLPVMVVIGNPPYSGVSSNKNVFANNLIHKYKFEPGTSAPLEEKKHRLDDDYVKFIAYAENLILRNGHGIVAFVVNHGFIDNASYRGMRWHLLNTFDEIRVVDLHGNLVKRATGSTKDENVFAIKQGVALLVAIRKKDRTKKSPLGKVLFAELTGTKESKFFALESAPELESISVSGPLFNFKGEAVQHSGITVEDLFEQKTSGIQTSRDHFAVDIDRLRLEDRILRFSSPSLSDDEVRQEFFASASGNKYPAGDTREWSVAEARPSARILDTDNLCEPYLYRPFDVRYLANTEVFVDWPRTKVMRNIGPGRPALIVGREGKAVGSESWNLVFATDMSSDLNVFYRGGGQVMPLYVRTPSGWVSNLNFDATERLFSDCDLSFNPDLEGAHVINGECGPEAVFSYLYGLMHSNKYREANKTDLRLGFPPIANIASREEFVRFSTFGSKLLGLHLPHSQAKVPNQSPAKFAVTGSNNVERVSRVDERVFINEHQYFEGVTQDVWAYEVGGYFPAQKYLQDRKDQHLTYENVTGYLMLVSSISETLSLVDAFDETEQ